MTGREVQEVTSSVQKYFDNDPKYVDENEAIDALFTPRRADDDPAARRFRSSDTVKKTIAEWILKIESMYLANLPSKEFGENFVHCATECDWGNNMSGRARAHLLDQGTSYIFAVYNAITRQLGCPPPKQVALFLIWMRDPDLCNIAEIVGNILCSTLWIEGGLNCEWPGGFGDSVVTASMLPTNLEVK